MLISVFIFSWDRKLGDIFVWVFAVLWPLPKSSQLWQQ